MSQAERAKQELYGEAGVRDELTDDEADVLLKWAETQIDSLAAQGMDDQSFDQSFKHLRHIVTNINRYTGKRTYASPEELQGFLDQMVVEAQALGANVTAEQLAAPSAQAADDNIALIQSLTAMVTPGAISMEHPPISASVTDEAAPSPEPAQPPPDTPVSEAPLTPPPEAAPAPESSPSAEEDKQDDDWASKLKKWF
jgi:hypothetical protein